jgi:flagellar motor switch protein FliM
MEGEQSMTDEPVLTDEEKGALLEGMSTGEVEVHSSNGPQYAEVRAFEIGPRSRIVSNSYPRLIGLNGQLASRLGKQVEQMLNAPTDISSKGVTNCTCNEFLEAQSGLSLVVEFTAEPLHGTALIHAGAPMIGHLVETFFGGDGNDSSHQADTFFTSGEINVARLFANALLSAMQDIWEPITRIEPQLKGAHQATDVIEGIDSGDSVIVCDFEITIAERREDFRIVWPLATLAPLVPVFEGQKRERDAAEDARWEKTLRAGVVDSVIDVSTTVGHTGMTLGEVAELSPGDVITIGNPQRGMLLASKVAVIEGRFGVHDGRYAIEASKWLGHAASAAAASR